MPMRLNASAPFGGYQLGQRFNNRRPGIPNNPVNDLLMSGSLPGSSFGLDPGISPLLQAVMFGQNPPARLAPSQGTANVPNSVNATLASGMGLAGAMPQQTAQPLHAPTAFGASPMAGTMNLMRTLQDLNQPRQSLNALDLLRFLFQSGSSGFGVR